MLSSPFVDASGCVIISSLLITSMSSCSEYLVRQQLRAPKYIDTRPKMTCGQMTEIQRQQAESQVYEQFLPATACVSTLNAPGTRGPSTRTFARGHRVKDASAYVSYASASSTSAMTSTRNDKQFALQIQPGVSKMLRGRVVDGGDGSGLGTITIPTNGVTPATAVNQVREINDTILLSTLIPTTDRNYRKEDIIAAARQAIGPAVCVTCGRVSWQEGNVKFASGCAGCPGVNAGDTKADGTLRWKSAIAYQRTVT